MPRRIKSSITWGKLAKELKVSLTFIKTHRKKKGGPGDSKDLDLWRSYITQVEALRPSGRNVLVHETKISDVPVFEVKDYTTKDIINLKAKLTEEQARVEEYKRLLKEIELKKETEDLVPGSLAKEVIAGVLVPLKRNLSKMGRTIGPQANPQDPALAEQAINNHVTHIFRGISSGKDIMKND